MTTLNALDLAMLAMDTPARPMNLGATMLFDTPAGERTEAMVHRTLEAFRAARPVAPWDERPATGLGRRPCWETVPEMDLDLHVKHVSLPAPGTVAQLLELVEELYPPRMDRGRPLWEVHVVDGLDGGDRMALFFKGHHAAADGAHALRLVLAGLSDTPGREIHPPWAI